MDLEEFLMEERQQLQMETERLSARGENSQPLEYLKSVQQEETMLKCPALQFLNDPEFKEIRCRRQQQQQNENEANHCDSKKLQKNLKQSTHPMSSMSKNAGQVESKTFSLNTQQPAEGNKNAAAPINVRDEAAVAVLELSKRNKVWVNLKEMHDVDSKDSNDKENVEQILKKGTLGKKKDDMEQWVSDTFYSYFPGFNNEYQKRQNYLRERQLEYQENFIKHQMSHPPLTHAQKSKNSNLDTARSTSSTTTSYATDKTDLEIIVNNPNYVPPSSKQTTQTTRPGSLRHKLLQDLRHTELSHIIGSEAIGERNQRHAELEMARKKDYQRELMQQIEEKRRSIEVLREKERQQDAELTRRLQDQLKTIELQEALEKEKMRADKLHFDTEQNRLMREQLLTKLENDTKLLYANKNKNINKNIAKTKEETTKQKDKLDMAKPGVTVAVPTPSSSTDSSNNKVYKYFSNSARHEYRRGKPLPAEGDLDMEIPEKLAAAAACYDERECFHLSEKVCPMCDAPLRSYESCCLRCQKKLSLKMRKKVRHRKTVNGNDGEKNATNERKDTAERADEDEEEIQENGEQSYSLVCVQCERFYAICGTCVSQNDVCRACHRKRNVCLNCRCTLCSFCLEEIACGRDTERRHINDENDEEKKQKNDANMDSERSFQVLEVNYAPHKTEAEPEPEFSSPPRHIHNNLYSEQEIARPAYSINIERNSIFHPDYNTKKKSPAVVSFEPIPNIIDKQLSFDLDLDTSSSLQTDELTSMERVRKETDRRLSRYLKNYGDLAATQRSKSESRHRSTQTTPDTAARRDIVLHEEHNLSMPLLREMPKMTRQEQQQQQQQQQQSTMLNNQRKIDQLKRRWEIPAVQKFTISSESPRVLTQVGAIRKQLQADRLLLDNAEY